jgi:hypothetical protein
MEGTGHLTAPRAAAPDGGIPSPVRVARRLKPVAARHARLQYAAQSAARLQSPARFESPAAGGPLPAGGLDQAVAVMDGLRSTALADARLFGFP